MNSTKIISKERLYLLNNGLDESKNLMETLNIDFNILSRSLYPSFSNNFNEIKGITKKMVEIALAIINHKGYEEISILSKHNSDIVRGWACYMIGLSHYDLEKSLVLIKPLADDNNSGVKEWAWLGMRNKISKNIEESLELLLPWAKLSSANLRRFASESTRPRGVWSAYIPKLRQNPNIAINLLTTLNQDSAKYVQNSVGNWLNDAGKDNKDWVIKLCNEWQQLNNAHTNKIIKRGLRNLIK